MTKSVTPDHSEVDIHELLAQRRQVAVICSSQDVQRMHPYLNDHQAWEVLQYCINRYNCEMNLVWLIGLVTKDIFPFPESNE
jgi:hypothetical protein